MNSAYSILAATHDDLPVLAAYLQASKLNLAINRFLYNNWPNNEVQKAKYTSAIAGSLDEPTTTSLKVVNTTTGELIAYMFLTPRKSGKSKKPQNSTADGGSMDGLNREVLAAVEKVVAEINRQWADTDYLGLFIASKLPNTLSNTPIELTHIFVKPEFRKQGIGSQLIQRAFEEARAANVSLVTCAEPLAYDFFKNRGFQSTKHGDIDLRLWSPEYCGYGIFRITGIYWNPVRDV